MTNKASDLDAQIRDTPTCPLTTKPPRELYSPEAAGELSCDGTVSIHGVFDGKNWYAWKDGVWSLDENGEMHRNRVEENVADKYREVLAVMGGPLSPDSENRDTEARRAIDTVTRGMGYLWVYDTLRSGLSRTGREIFYDDAFMEKVQANSHKLCYENGVIVDLNREDYAPRKPVREDYQTAVLPFPRLSTPKPRGLVWQTLCQILPDEEVRSYVLHQISRARNGTIPAKLVMFWVGGTASGKSLISKFIAKYLGQHACVFDPIIFQQPDLVEGAAMPELVRLEGKRIALGRFIEQTRLNWSNLERITGGGEIVGRGLYEGTRKLHRMPVFIIATSILPKFDFNDSDIDSVSKYRCIVPFKSKFVRRLNPKEPAHTHIYPFDQDLPQKLKTVECYQEFDSILDDHQNPGIAMPDACKYENYKS